MCNMNQESAITGLDDRHKKIAEHFVECFGEWADDIKAFKDSGPNEVTVIMHSGKQYQFSYKYDGGVYLHSHYVCARIKNKY